MGVSLLFSLLLGLWIARIIDQSRGRAELIEELDATRAELAQAHHAQGVMASGRGSPARSTTPWRKALRAW